MGVANPYTTEVCHSIQLQTFYSIWLQHDSYVYTSLTSFWRALGTCLLILAIASYTCYPFSMLSQPLCVECML